MNIKQEKKRLRKWARETGRALNAVYKDKSDRAICEKLHELDEYAEAGTVFCFVGTADEIDTSEFLEKVWNDGKRLAVPRCEGRGIMNAYEISSMDELEEGMYGIMEPVEGCRRMNPDEIDFAVIPCLSCDEKGYRLGHGGGYYDRYLEKTGCSTAVVCREALIADEMPAEPTDIPAGVVVTEERLILTEYRKK